MGHPLSYATTCALLALTNSIALADLVNVDLDGFVAGETPETYVGAGAIGSAGDFWNSVSVQHNSAISITTPALTAADGSTLTGVSLTLMALPNSGSQRIGGDFNNGAGNALFNDNAFAGPPTSLFLDFTITGLNPTAMYDLYLYSDFVNDDGGIFTIDGVQKSAVGGAGGAFIEGVSYVAFLGLSPNASNEIVGRLTPVGGGDLSGTFSGLQLATVPEPSSFFCLGLVAATFGVMRLRAVPAG